LHEGMVAVWRTTEADHEIPFGWGPVPGDQHRKNLRSLADRALSWTSDLAGWYRLGAALGQAQVRIGQVDDTALESELQAVARVAGTLPPTERRLVPGLERLTARLPELRKLGPSHFLAQVLRPDEDVQPLAEKTTIHDLRLGLIALDRHIQTTLRTLKDSKPRWDGDTRTLWFGDSVCKRYTRPAPSQEKILTSFQEEGWPNRIDDPLDPGKLADTIKDPLVVQAGVTTTTDGKWALFVTVPRDASVPIRSVEDQAKGFPVIYEAEPDEPPIAGPAYPRKEGR